jgi:hypothetical protein
MAAGRSPEDDFDLDIRVVSQGGPASDRRLPPPTGIRCLTPWCAPTVNCPPTRRCG